MTSTTIPDPARRAPAVLSSAADRYRDCVSSEWPALPYEAWAATCDTLHAHTQVLGKLAVALAPPEPQLQHAALRLSARGWETLPLPAPDGSGALVVALDLRSHEAVAEHSDGRAHRVALAPDRPVGEVTREVLAAVRGLAGPVRINPRPQETPWTTPLDEDDEHATYDPAQVDGYFAAAIRAALVLAALRAPYRGRSTPVNAWWGSFDLAVSLFSGLPAEPPSQDFIMRNAGDVQQIEVGWWPGDGRYPRAAFFAYAHPAPEGFATGALSPAAAHWDAGLGEYVLDWDDARAAPEPHRAALEFAQSAVRHACAVCGWDPVLSASAEGIPRPVALLDARRCTTGGLAARRPGSSGQDGRCDARMFPGQPPGQECGSRGPCLVPRAADVWLLLPALEGRADPAAVERTV